MVPKVEECYLFLNVHRNYVSNVGSLYTEQGFMKHYQNHTSRDIIISRVCFFEFKEVKLRIYLAVYLQSILK